MPNMDDQEVIYNGNGISMRMSMSMSIGNRNGKDDQCSLSMAVIRSR